MGGLDRLRSLDNVVLTGFGLYQGQLGGGDLSPDPRAPHKYQVSTDAQRTFDLKGKRALVQDRRASLFPFAAAANPNRSQQLQVGVAMLDHPLTALLAALDSATKLGAVTIEDGVPVVEFSLDAGPPLRIAIDPATHLPAWVRWISASDTLGDVTNTAYFTGYSAVRRRAASDRHHDCDRLAQHHDVGVPGRLVSAEREEPAGVPGRRALRRLRRRQNRARSPTASGTCATAATPAR